jgi:uncharacterized membrane protein YczE
MPKNAQEETKTEVIFVRKNALFRDLREFVIINLGSLGVATAVFFFMMPSQVAVGSISALSMVLANFLPVPMSVINLIINVLLLIVGFLLVGSEFGAKTVYTSIMIPLFVGVFEFLLPHFQSLTSDPLLDVLCYIVIVSISMALLFLRNASSGGLDIVAKILHKYMESAFVKETFEQCEIFYFGRKDYSVALSKKSPTAILWIYNFEQYKKIILTLFYKCWIVYKKITDRK